MADTVKISVVFNKPAFVYLKAEAERLGISIGELLRRIVDERRESR